MAAQCFDKSNFVTPVRHNTKSHKCSTQTNDFASGFLSPRPENGVNRFLLRTVRDVRRRQKTPHSCSRLHSNSKDMTPSSIEICCICLENLEQENDSKAGIDCCHHEFHFECIKAWSKINNTCPLCKHRFTTIKSNDKQIEDVHVENVEQESNYTFDVDMSVLYFDECLCKYCGSGEDEELLLLCDFTNENEDNVCNNAYHTYCVGLGDVVPQDDWFCPQCCQKMVEMQSAHKNKDDENTNQINISSLLSLPFAKKQNDEISKDKHELESIESILHHRLLTFRRGQSIRSSLANLFASTKQAKKSHNKNVSKKHKNTNNKSDSSQVEEKDFASQILESQLDASDDTKPSRRMLTRGQVKKLKIQHQNALEKTKMLRQKMKRTQTAPQTNDTSNRSDCEQTDSDIDENERNENKHDELNKKKNRSRKRKWSQLDQLEMQPCKSHTRGDSRVQNENENENEKRAVSVPNIEKEKKRPRRQSSLLQLFI